MDALYLEQPQRAKRGALYDRSYSTSTTPTKQTKAPKHKIPVKKQARERKVLQRKK